MCVCAWVCRCVCVICVYEVYVCFLCECECVFVSHVYVRLHTLRVRHP